MCEGKVYISPQIEDVWRQGLHFPHFSFSLFSTATLFLPPTLYLSDFNSGHQLCREPLSVFLASCILSHNRVEQIIFGTVLLWTCLSPSPVFPSRSLPLCVAAIILYSSLVSFPAGSDGPSWYVPIHYNIPYRMHYFQQIPMGPGQTWCTIKGTGGRLGCNPSDSESEVNCYILQCRLFWCLKPSGVWTACPLLRQPNTGSQLKQL